MEKIIFALFLLALSLTILVDGHFVTIHQNADKVGTMDLIDSVNGEVIKQVSPQFEKNSLIFSWPYAEMTSDLLSHHIFAVIFPDNSNNSILYQFNAELETMQTWSSTPFWFFDLQFLLPQQSLYGIKVTSTYGRVFSQFHILQDMESDSKSDVVDATELFTLPYMWYVNASTCDNIHNRYFALLNYFPGHPESTLDQKLLVARLSTTAVADQTYSVLDISNNGNIGIVHFISYSAKAQTLFALSSAATTVYLSALDTTSGSVQKVFGVYENVVEIGPLMVDDIAQILTFFVKTSTNKSMVATSAAAAAVVTSNLRGKVTGNTKTCAGDVWQLVQLSLNNLQETPKVIRCFDDSTQYKIFAAAAKF